jgi:DNA-binding IclR family transcriptional regulator
MSRTLLRGLKMLELLDFYGPSTVTELAERLQVDKATASRLASACIPEGWVVRENGRVLVGPRAALLGQSNPIATTLRGAEPLVHGVCGVTGLLTQVVVVLGGHGVILANSSPGRIQFPAGLTSRMPLWATAAGKVLAAQLTRPQLDRLLPAEPFPAPSELTEPVADPSVLVEVLAELGGGMPSGWSSSADTLVRTRAELDRDLNLIRAAGRFRDVSEMGPGISCLAVPWPQPGLAAAMVCIGTIVALDRDEPMVERALRAAVAPGATRGDIVAAAAKT